MRQNASANGKRVKQYQIIDDKIGCSIEQIIITPSANPFFDRLGQEENLQYNLRLIRSIISINDIPSEVGLTES